MIHPAVLCTRGDAPDELRTFIDLVLTAEAQELIAITRIAPASVAEGFEIGW